MSENKEIDDSTNISKAKLGRSVSSCLLDQSMFTFFGVVAGTVITLRTKNPKYFILNSFAGTVGDLTYGGLVGCRQVIDEYNACVEQNSDERKR